MITFWIISIIVFLIIEYMTFGLTTIWFAIGSTFSLTAALFNVDITLQIIIFFIVSLMMFFFTRPVVQRYFNKNLTATNVDEVIGEKAIVIEAINNLEAKGVVDLKGQEWTARSADDKTYNVDEVVEIKQVKGVTLFVTKVK